MENTQEKYWIVDVWTVALQLRLWDHEMCFSLFFLVNRKLESVI